MPAGEPYRAVILTAIETEYEAVLAHLTDLRFERHGRIFYQLGTFATQIQVWDVAIRATSAGNVCAAVETLLAIQYFDPLIILFVGVAGCLKDAQLGDIVIPTKVYSYESGRANVSTFQTRPQVVQPMHLLVELAQAEARPNNWLQRLRQPLPNPLPKVLAAPIASGESVVASTRSAISRFLKTNFSDAIAVEMEGYGFLLAASYYSEVPALVIRGISDRLSGKARTDANNWQQIAAYHTSAFAFEVLSKVDVADLQRRRRGIKPLNEPTTTDTGSSKTDIHEPSPTIQPPPAAIVIDEVLKSLKHYHDRISEILPSFGERRRPFADECRHAIHVLSELKTLLQKYRQDFPSSDLSFDFTIKRLSNLSEALIQRLDDLYHLLSSSQSAHDIQREVNRQLGQLLNTLKQFVNMIESLIEER